MTTTNPKTQDLRAANAAEVESWRNFLDLQVPLTIELGRTRLTARGVLDIEPNSIIQLQRSTAEGVDVVASRTHIARGEIIMIEDRTGIRITEIVVSKRKP
jgi:flagellar motor switch protein FliN/FliY